MTLKKYPSFEELVEYATKFVEKQGGTWDHTAWLEFLAEIQQKGVKITHEMQAYMGNVIESMKKLHNSITSTSGLENIMLAISDNTVKFVKKTQGSWDHSGWEAYIKDIQKKGVELNEESKSYLGKVLESAKELYSIQSSE
ncbi:MAG: hypothetical protein L3V56_07900 [Candidatus Magnetoovum sp. WYHC-5]|nr:hypothetical protein [Candidatus Magnetoovum sp. WYHC-5]